MQFQVPQFIEVEDKIFGPLTLKQFLYLAGGGAAIFLLFVVLPFFLFIILSIPIAAFSVALAFYQMNNQPFIKIIENAFTYSTKSKIYTWKKKEKISKIETETPKTEGQRAEQAAGPTLTKGKLSDLAWSLDIKEQTKHE